MLSKKVFIFLKSLKNHNNRPWFKENISNFRAAETNVKLLYSELYNELNHVDSIDKFKVFSIYRDVRIFYEQNYPIKRILAVAFIEQNRI